MTTKHWTNGIHVTTISTVFLKSENLRRWLTKMIMWHNSKVSLKVIRFPGESQIINGAFLPYGEKACKLSLCLQALIQRGRKYSRSKHVGLFCF